MKLFLAVELTDAVRAEIVSIQSQLGKTNTFVGKFVEPENLHITLKFIGEIESNRLGAIKNVLEQAFAGLKKTDIQISHPEGAYSGKRLRLIWLTVSDANNSLLRAHELADTALAKLNIPRDTKYTNHITLVRIKSVSDMKKLEKFLLTMNKESMGSFSFNKIYLMESKLTGIGPQYGVLSVYELT